LKGKIYEMEDMCSSVRDRRVELTTCMNKLEADVYGISIYLGLGTVS